MSRYRARVIRLESQLSGSVAVAQILGRITCFTDEELSEFIESGELVAVAQRLGDRQLDRLIAELELMLVKAKGDVSIGPS